MNHYIAKVRQYIAYQFNDLDLHDQIYKLSGLMLAAYLAIAAIAQMASEATLRTYITEPFVWVFGLTLAVAVIIEHWAHIKPYVETKWFKFVGAVLSYFAYQLPEIKAHHFINSYTGIDPAQLGDAATLPTALYVVYVWIIIAFALVALAGLLTCCRALKIDQESVVLRSEN
ncbi:MAG: hypothetical protein ABF271_12225 [Abyssibacter sp.]|uniref:hypothetical protein n=1 Tax=Abyssibacter sp. TaxID=2320200 RepID=UPI0032193125